MIGKYPSNDTFLAVFYCFLFTYAQQNRTVFACRIDIIFRKKSVPRSRLLRNLAILLVALTVPHVLSAQSVLNFPRVISNGSLFTGLAVSNPTTAEVSVTFTAFLPDGTPFSATGVQNPITMKIPAGGQAAKLSTEIFGSRDFNGWVQATSSSSGLTGFFLNGNTALTDLDGAGSVTPAGEFILPFASEDSVAKTEVTLVNVNSDPATATLTLYGDDGTSAGTKDIAFAGRGFIRQTLSVLFPNTNLSGVTHIRVQANRPLIGHEVVADYALAGSAVRRETAAISGQPATAATSYVLPEFATGGGWISLLGIVNAGGVGQQVTVTAYKEDGTVWNIPGNPRTISLEGNGALRGTVGDLFGFPAATLATGWLQVSSTLGYVSSYIAYGNTATPSFAAVTGTDATAGSQIDVFSQVAEGIGFFTGLTLVNPGAQDATLQFYTLRPDGTTVGTATLTVKPKQRIGELFTEILPSSLLQVGGWALIRSSQPLVAAVLFGSTNGYALANVPQQIPAGDFTPPSQQTGAINGTVRSNGAGIANIQVTLSGPVTATTTTDDQGRYIFSQLPAGDYKVTPVRAGAQFVPAVRSATINKQNIDGADFEGGGLTNSNAPAIQFISPASTFAGNASLNVRILGSNFTPASVVQFNGQAAPTTYISSAELQAVLSADQLKAASALLVTVSTPPPGGGVSASITFTVNPVPSNPLIRGRATVGSFPAGVAIDTTRNTALITNQSSDSVTVLDLKTLQVTSSIAVGRSPAEGIAIHAGKNIALVANPGSNNVSVIDLQANREVRKIAVGNFPVGVAINSSTNRALVTNANDDTVSVIDLDSFSVTGQISVGTRPEGIAIEPLSNKAVVTNTGSNDAWILDLNTNAILARIGVGQFPRGVAISSSSNVAVVTNANSNDVSVIDLAGRSLLYTVKVDTGPTGVAIHEMTNSALIANSGVGRGSSDFSAQTTVSVLDIARRTISTTIQVGAAAFGIGINPDAQEAVVADFGSNDVTVIRVPNPVPQVTDVNPKTFPAGGSGFTVTVTGSGFIPTSVVTLNGQALPTTYISATELRADISSSIVQQLLQLQVQTSGIKAGAAVAAATAPTFDISVRNPGPGGGSAPPPLNPASTHLTPLNGLPVLISISPTDTTVGAGAIVLTLNGNNFNSTSSITFGGSALAPTSTSLTSMSVTLPANILVPGTYPVSVTNPAPGGGTSVPIIFTVNSAANPAPVVTSVTPTSVAAGSGATGVTVVGSGFVPGTTASSLGSAKGTVSGNTITFSLSAADLQNSGTLNGLISNPSPGGGSASFSVSVLNPVPTVTKFSPGSVAAGSADLGMTVSGTNFLGSSSITIEGTPVPTQFVSPTQLTGTVPATFLRKSGNVRVGVQNKAPGGGSADGGLLSITSALPTLTSVNPTQTLVLTVPVDVTVQLIGTGFAGNSAVKANGTSLTPVFNSATSLTVTLPAAILGSAGPIDITVSNPAPGGGTSGSVRFNVTNPVPTLLGVSPNQLRGDQTNVVLTITGQNFVKTSTVALGATALVTTFVSPTQLTAVTPSPLPFGKVTVTVSSPGPGGGKSNGIDIDISSLTPTITSVTPSAGAGGTIQVTGTNFGPGTVILLRGQAIPTTVVSTTSLTGTIPLNAAAGIADVVVQNPATSSTPALNSAPGSITILNPTPAITSLSPNPALGNAVPQTITVTGSGFVPSSIVQVNGVSVATSFSDGQTLSFILPTVTSAASIQVVNPVPGGGPSNAVTLNVTLPPPAISALTPPSGVVNTTIALTVSGSNFISGATIKFGGVPVATTFVNFGTLTASVTLGGTAGPVPVTVTNPDGTTSGAATFQITPAGPPPLQPPTLTSINPSAGVPGTNVPVTLTGTNFIAGATALVISGTGITGNSVAVTSGTALTATFVISPTAPLGNYSVAVSTAGGTSGTVTFAVASTAPVYFNDFETPATTFNALTVSGSLTDLTVVSLPTDSGGVNSPNQSKWLGNFGSGVTKTPGTSELLTLSLNGLVPGVRYAVAFDLLIGSSWDGSALSYGPDEWVLTATSGVNTTTLVDATFSNCGLSNELCGAYSPQSYSDATPLAGPSGTLSAETGADFFSDTNQDYSQDYGIYYFGHGAGNPLLSFTAGATTATLTFGRPIQSNDSSDEYWALDNILVAAVAAPALSSISPTSGNLGVSVPVTLTGSNFVPGATAVTVSGTGVTVTSVNVVSSTSLTATFVIDPTAAAGLRNVSVNTAGGITATVPFTVAFTTPTLVSVIPNSGMQGTTVPVTLTGSNFVIGATAITVSGTGVTVTSVVVSDPTSLTAGFIVDPSAPAGARGVTVSTTIGTSGSQAFTVLLPPTPTLSSVSPNSGGQGISVPVTLTGSNFAPGATTVIVSGTGITVTSVNVSNTTSLTATFVIDPTAATGPRNISVNTVSGTSTTVPFTVTSSAPTLASIVPNSGVQGTTVPVTLTGTNFVIGATAVAVSGTGVTVTSVVVSNPTSLTASFIVDPNAAAGARGVTVSTTIGTSGSQVFTVLLPPTPTLLSISPNSGGQGVSVPVTLTGSNFAPGATTVIVSGTGITVTSVNVASTTSLTATFVIDPTAATGLRNVSVNTAGGTSTTVPFTVTSTAPTLASVAPNSGMQGTVVPVTLTGTNFVIGATAVTVGGTGVTVNSVVVSNATTLTASFVIDPNAPAGGLGVTVSTAIGTSGSQTFTVLPPPAPALAGINVSSGVQGATVPVSITGSGFVPGGTLLTSSGSGIVVEAVNVTSPSSLTALLLLNGTPGLRGLSVSTAFGTSGSLGFTINPSSLQTASAYLSAHLAGSVGGTGYLDGTGSAARFSFPFDVWSDGTNAYLTDNGTIRKIVLATGVTTTFAGAPGQFDFADGVGSAARFSSARGIWGDGTNLYVADTNNSVIRQVELATAKVTTLAGSPFLFGTQDGFGSEAQFGYPAGLWGDGLGSLYVTDGGTDTVRQITISSGLVVTIAGSPFNIGSSDGFATDGATFNFPQGVWGDGANLYITDSGNATIRRLEFATNDVTTLAGTATITGKADGTGASAQFFNPTGIWGDGTSLYVADSSNELIRKIDIATANVTTFAGSGSGDGTGTAAGFADPTGIFGDASNLYVVDTQASTLRKIVLASAAVTTIAGQGLTLGVADGTGSAARFIFPSGAWGDGTNLYVADSTTNVIRKVVLATGTVSTFAGTTGLPGSADGIGTAASFSDPLGVWGDGVNLYVADSANHTIRKIVIATGVVTTIAGTPTISGSADGIGPAALFNFPIGIWGDGSNLYIADTSNTTIRQIVLATGAVTTIAGTPRCSDCVGFAADGIGPNARFASPLGIWGDGVNLYIADSGANAVRQLVLATANVTTLAGVLISEVSNEQDGIGNAAGFISPTGITGDGSYLYVADNSGQTIRKIEIATATVTTLAGTPRLSGGQDGIGSLALFSAPFGIWSDGSRLYITEDGAIRTLTAVTLLQPSLLAVTPSSGPAGTDVAVTLTGGNFDPKNTTITVAGGGVTASPVILTAAGTALTTLTIDPAAAAGARTITVSTSAGNSNALTFTVNAGAPILTGINPGSGSQGTSVPVTLTGSNLIPGATALNVSGAGITVTAVSVTSGTAMTATFVIDPAAATGDRSVTVNTASGTSGAVTFTITPPSAPTLGLVTPANGTQGATVPVTLTGTGFISGATSVIASTTGILVSSVNVISSTSLTATFVLNGAPGAVGISVATAGGSSGSQPFTINANVLGSTAAFAVTHVAGTGGFGKVDGTGSGARFNQPQFAWSDGTNLYVSDRFNHTIRKIVQATGVVTTVAGTPESFGYNDAAGAAAQFFNPEGLWGDGGSNLYVADQGNRVIRKIDLSTGLVTTLAGAQGQFGTTDGSCSAARFGTNLQGLWGDANNLYIVDSASNTIRQIALAGCTVSTMAGLAGFSGTTDLPGAGARFSSPMGVWGDGTNLYISDYTNNTIRQVQIALPNNVSTLVTSGGADPFQGPYGIWGDGTNLYVADFNNSRIRKVAISTGSVTNLAGATTGYKDATGTAAQFSQPVGMAGNAVNIFVVDTGNNVIRTLAFGTPVVGTLAGLAQAGGYVDGPAGVARLNGPQGAWGDGSNLYVVDQTYHVVRKIVLATGAVSTLAGIGTFGAVDGPPNVARFQSPQGVWGDGTNLYVADRDNFTIRTVSLATGTVSTLAGSAGQSGSTDATGPAARFKGPTGIWGDGANLYVIDNGSAIRKIVIATAAVTTVAGTQGLFGIADGTGPAAQFNGAEGIWGDGTNLYVTDFSSNSIRKVVIASGVVTTFAGSAGTSGSTDAVGTSARFNIPIGIWGDGKSLYVAETSNQTIRKIDLATAAVSTVAGTALNQGTDDAIGTQARFMNPNYVWGDGTNIYVTDNYVVRMLTNFGSPVLAALTPVSVSQGTTVSATLFGSNFTPNATVSVSGGGITVSPVTVTGGGTLLANFIVSPSAATGTRSVAVSTSAGTSNVQTLTVNAAVPTLTSITPNAAAQGATQPVTLAGTNFVVGATTLAVSGTGIIISSPVVSSATSMTASFIIDPAATTGARSVTVNTAGGTSGSVTFTVNVSAPLAPAITALNIASGVQGATIPVTVTGTNFVAGATSLIASGTGLVVSSVNATSTTSLSAVLQLSGATGPYGLAAVTSAGSSSSLTFTINANAIASASQLDVSHFAGSPGGIGMVDGTTGAAARFNHPLALWSNGSSLYVADTVNSVIRQTSLSTGATTVFAGLPGTVGFNDGTALSARFSSPDGVWGDSVALYVADSGSSTIRRVLLSNGIVQTLAGTPGISGKNDGIGTAAQFNTPIGLWADSSSNFLYVADNSNNNIRSINIANGTVVTVAGSTSGLSGTTDGVGTAARFTGPVGIWGDGTNLYVADSTNNTIRKIVIATGAVTTVAGVPGGFGSADGIGSAASFATPWSMWGDGTNIYVGDIGNNNVRKIAISNMAVSTIAGSAGTVGWVDATGAAARFNSPNGLGGDPANIYVADGTNSAIRKIDFGTNVVTTLAGQPAVQGSTNAAGTAARFSVPAGVTGDGTNLYIADSGNVEIRKAVISSGSVSTLAGTDGVPGTTDGTGAAARFLSPNVITTDGVNLYVADNNAIRKVVIATGVVTTLAGAIIPSGSADGIGSAASFDIPQGLWSDGTNLYVSDSQNNTIRKVVIATGAVTTIAGQPGQSTFFADGTGTAARLFLPAGIWGDGANLYIADTGNNRIRKMNLSTLAVTTLAGSSLTGIVDGTGAAAQFAGVFGLWGDGTNLYVTEKGRGFIRKVGIATGTVTTIAGRDPAGFYGADDGRGSVAQFNTPVSIWGDGNSLYVADQTNQAIRKLTLSLPAPVLTAAVPNQMLDLPAPSTVTVGLTGDNFAPGSTTVSATGSGGITIGTVKVISRTLLTVDLTISVVNGNYNLTVTTPSGTSNSVPFAFLTP
jgi:YVTN family beta-propeller protein